jgi:methionyl-tRNA formyltransferase
MNKKNTQYNIAFFGTPALCIPILDTLAESGYLPNLVITNPDRPVGRKQILTPPPVKTWSEQHNIETLQPEKLTSDVINFLAEKNFDLFIVVAYGKIIPETLINLPKHGTLNIHYSLLPRWRGASPVEAALLHGDTETGVCIQQMVYQLDAGPIIARQTHPIVPEIVGEDLLNELNRIGAELLVTTLPDVFAGKTNPEIQDVSAVTTCSKISKADGEVSLEDMTDSELWNRYRAYYGWPGIFYFDNEGKRVKITKASLRNGVFTIEKIIPEGKKEITYA